MISYHFAGKDELMDQLVTDVHTEISESVIPRILAQAVAAGQGRLGRLREAGLAGAVAADDDGQPGAGRERQLGGAADAAEALDPDAGEVGAAHPAGRWGRGRARLDLGQVLALAQRRQGVVAPEGGGDPGPHLRGQPRVHEGVQDLGRRGVVGVRRVAPPAAVDHLGSPSHLRHPAPSSYLHKQTRTERKIWSRRLTIEGGSPSPREAPPRAMAGDGRENQEPEAHDSWTPAR